MTTALTLYPTNSNSATLSSTAKKLLENPSTGATASNLNTNLTANTTGWVELWSFGNGTAQSGAGSEPSPDGQGWIDDSTTLEGNHFDAGNWTWTVELETTTSGTFVCDIHCRAYQRSSSGTYTLITEGVLTGQTVISSGYTDFTVTSTGASSSNTFATGDKFYTDVIINITSNSTSANMRVHMANSSTTGYAAVSIVTPGYDAISTVTRTIPSTIALLGTSTRTIPATVAILQPNNTRTIPTTTTLLQTNTRTIPATVSLGSLRAIPATIALIGTLTRTIPATVPVLQPNKTRTIPTTTALLQTNIRTIPATSALLQTNTRTIPATAPILQPNNTRTIPTTFALINTFTRTIPTSLCLYQPAVFYATNVLSTISGITQSDYLVQLPGGTETSFTVTMPASGTNTYVELLSQGGIATATNALPSPTGKGWAINLNGNTILAGSWSGIFTLSKSGSSMSGASLIVRWYRRTMSGTYYTIGTTTLPSQTFSITKTIYTLPTIVSNMVWQFVSGDTLYMDAFVANPTTAWASDVFTIYVSSSATLGVYNDGTTIAPTIMTTPAGLTCLIGSINLQTGTSLSVRDQSFTLADALDQRSILTLTGEDSSGTLFFTRGMPVVFSDHDQGLLYTGYVNSDKITKISANTGITQVEHQLTFMDHHYAADKRANTINYLNWASGDIVSDVIQKTLSQEGITGNFALESDYTPTTFTQGTLSGTVATTTTSPFTYAPNTANPPITTNTGDLELTRAGTQFMLEEAVTADFSSGTLSNMVATSNSLQPTTVNALKMQTFLPYTYGVEIAPSQISISGGTANVSGSGSFSGTANVSGTANLTAFYTPSGFINISGGNPGESASFSGSGASINPTGSVSSSGSANTSGSVNSSGPVTGITADSGYQARYRSSVTVNGQHYAVTTADAAVVDNRIDAVIWTGSMTVGSGDTLNYDIWVASTCPMFQAGVELYFSDGTSLTEYDGQPDTNFSVGQWDQNLLAAQPIQDLSDYAKDAWYTRNIDLNALSGKTITAVSLFNSANQTSTYDIYYKNIYLGSHSGSPFFSTSSTVPAVNPPTISAIGAYVIPATVVSVVPVYTPANSYRISPAHSIDSVRLVQNSNITWVASTPTFGPTVSTGQPGAATTAGSVALFISYDGTTWLPCTNNQALPGLPAGANVAGMSFYLLESFSGGQDPTAIPSLLQVLLTINSAANTTTTDIVASYGTTAGWNSGTLSGAAPNTNGDLALAGSSYSWSNLNNMTYVPGNASRSNPTQSTSSGAYVISSGGSSSGQSWSSSRFNFLAAVQNFTAEADFTLSDSSSPRQNEIGFVYRQTYWGSPNNSFAYYIRIMRAPGGQAGGTSVSIGYGINNPPSTGSSGGGPSAGTFTTLIQIGETINSGTTYHVKLVVSQDRHTVYWNHGSSPIIDIIDGTYTAAGNIGLRTFVDGGSSVSGKIANLTVTNTFSGTWISPSVNLNSLGTCGNTQISWTEVTAQNNEQSTAVVLASLDGGTTWTQCTNGSTTPTTSIPGLPPGTNVTGKSLKIQVILYSTGLLTSPIITGLYARICGNYGTVTGTRISPVLSLTPVDYITNSNIMWNANIPTSTSISVATSQDANTWTTISSDGSGAALPYWTNQVAATQDLFTVVSSGNYTSTFKTGGSTASVFYDTANSRLLVANGSGALYLNNAISCTDIDILCDMDESDAGGLVWHEADTSNYYELGVYDASSSSGFTNQLRLYKVTSGVRNLLGTASNITFTRNTFHRVRVKMKGGLITVYFDGTCVQAYLDTAPISSGLCGIRNDGGTSRYYQLWIQPLGTNLSGQTLYTKMTLSTSDPSKMPQVFAMVTCVRGTDIGTGATIAQLHPLTTPFAAYFSAELDALVQVSGDYYWYIDKWRQLHFGPRLAHMGAFPLQSIDDIAKMSGSLLYNPTVTVLSSADIYRNQQVIFNVASLTTPPVELKIADGSATSWTLGYPVYSAPIITVNGQGATVGIQGIDNNKQFYWQPNNTSISYDSTLPKLPSGTIIAVTYVGQSINNVILNNTGNQVLQSALELNSGIVAEIEDANSLDTSTVATKGMTTAQATTFANGLLSRYGNNSTIELVGTTRYPGLTPGTVIPLFIPEIADTWNAQVPIVKVTTTAYQGNNSIIYLYSIDATNGPNLNNWQRLWF